MTLQLSDRDAELIETACHELFDPLDRSWDARWTREQQDEAVRRADEQVLQMRTGIDRAILLVEHAVNRHADALSWMAQARAFRDRSTP